MLANLAQAQTPPATTPDQKDPGTLPTVTVTVTASADASAQGLPQAFAGDQVARGGRVGILGTKDNLSTPFNMVSYTNDLIQDRQAASVGEVLQNDADVRVARGFGNFQESYFMRGFLLSSDDVAYNGLYSLLPRQYIGTELFERVEVLHGASAFLNGASPGGDGIGGAINLVPKRATDEPLTRLILGAGSGDAGSAAVDISRRFGPDNSTGIRVNAAYHDGGTPVDGEKASLGLGFVGFDWHSRDVRLSADVGYQDNRLRQTRPNVTVDAGVTAIPAAPDPSTNFAQPWSYSNERDLFSTFRGEWDINRDTTAWAAYGLRRSHEDNSLANIDLVNNDGASTTSRFDNTREDRVDTGELGLRGKLNIGGVKNEWVASYSGFRLFEKAAYRWDYFNTMATDLYAPTSYTQPAFTSGAFAGNILAAPGPVSQVRLNSVALGDTVYFFNDKLQVTAGLRRQELDVTSYAYDTGAATTYDRSRISPMASALYKLNKHFSLYGNYVEGLTQGDTAPTFGTTIPVNAGQSLAPYISKQTEVGLKYEDNALGGTLALFSTTKPRALTNTENVFTDDGEDRHRGLELNLYGKLAQDVKILGGVTLLDAIQEDTGSTATEGKRVIGVPRVQANIGSELAVPGVKGLSVDARVVYTGSSYADDLNKLSVPGWTRLDLGGRWITELGNTPTTFRLRVENATNRAYWSSVGGYPDNGYLVVGAPRSVELTASIDW